MSGRLSSRNHLPAWLEGKLPRILLLTLSAVLFVTGVAFWVPKEQAQLLLSVFASLAAAAITGWFSSRKPHP